MNYQTYAQLALSTEAKPEKLHAPAAAIAGVMACAIAAAEVIDQMKKVIFYGRAPNMTALVAAAEVLRREAKDFDEYVTRSAINGGLITQPEEACDFSQVNLRLMHHAFGRFGEAGELVNALMGQSLGADFDVINYVEEMGDGGWYDPIAYDVLGISEECIRTANLAKLLVVRYNKGFSAEAATNRKLASEREVIQWVVNRYADLKALGMCQDTPNVGHAVLAECRQLFCAEVPA